MSYQCKKEGCELKDIPQDYLKVRTVYRSERAVNLDLKTGKEIVCELCKTPLVFVKETEGWGSYSSCGFNGRTSEEKREILKKRARTHERSKGFQEMKRAKDNESII